MNAQTERFTISGPAGLLEVARDLAAAPDGVVRGTAVIAHPHPLFAGTMDNKVVQTLARAFVQSGWNALRFNFRGVGQSAGEYDAGNGERDDFLAVVQQLAPEGPLALAGFSFGSFVMSHALTALWGERSIDKVVLVGTAASRFTVATLPPEAHERTLVIHGEADAAGRCDGLGPATDTPCHSRARRQPFFPRTIAAAQRLGGAPPERSRINCY
mgnify:CR=1 FL=1